MCWRHTHRSRLIALLWLRAIQKALGDEATKRDVYAQQYEPAGSYGLCWKLYDGQDGWPMNCTKDKDHDGDCGRV